MGYLAYLIAAVFELLTGEGTTNQRLDRFLDTAAFWNVIFFWIALGIWLLTWLVPFIVRKVRHTEKKAPDASSLVGGCFRIVLTGWPVFRLLVLWLNYNMADAFSATAGVTDGFQFWVSVVFTAWLALS